MVASTHVDAHFLCIDSYPPSACYTRHFCVSIDFDFDFLCFWGHFNGVIGDGRALFSSAAVELP